MTETQAEYASSAMIVAPAVTPAVALPDLTGYGFLFHENGLDLVTSPVPEQFKCAGFLLGLYGTQMTTRARAWQLAFGDWLNYGENLYGEAASQYVDEVCTGTLAFDVDTLTGYRTVAARIQPPIRRVELDYSHFKEIAYGIGTADLRPAWVDWAAEEQIKRKAAGERRLSVRELRDKIRGAMERRDDRQAEQPDQDTGAEDGGPDEDEDESEGKWRKVTCPHCQHEFEIET